MRVSSHPGRAREREGFSMLEIMVAVGLLAVCLTPVVAFNQRSLSESGVTLEEMIARQAIINMCERYKNESPEVLRDLAASPDAIGQDPFLIDLDGARAYGFSRHISFVENSGGNSGLHEITFEVRWKSARRKVDRSLKIVRLIHWHMRS